MLANAATPGTTKSSDDVYERERGDDFIGRHPRKIKLMPVKDRLDSGIRDSMHHLQMSHRVLHETIARTANKRVWVRHAVDRLHDLHTLKRLGLLNCLG
jgi:hypothetical protein